MNEEHYRKLFGNLYMLNKDVCLAWLWISVSTNFLTFSRTFSTTFCSSAIILFCVICVLIFHAMMDVSNLFIFGKQVIERYLARLEVSESFGFKYMAPCVRSIMIYFVIYLLVCENYLQDVRGW